MKKRVAEPDYIGGQGQLTKEEENALTKYFKDKKIKTKRTIEVKRTSIKRKTLAQ